MKISAIIVAGGAGTRMGTGVPKQFLPVSGKPLLFHTLEKFSGIASEIILVLPATHISYWEELRQSVSCDIPHHVIEGGATRSKSVLNGLKALSPCDIVAIHDAVRPLVSKELITRLINETSNAGNAIPVIPANDSMRLVESLGSKAVNRKDYVLVQTPQCFVYQDIVKYYRLSDSHEYSDDASLAEAMGAKINLVPGETQNIKVTFKEDLLFAEQVLTASYL